MSDIIERLELYKDKYLEKEMSETDLQILVKKINEIIEHINNYD